MAQRAKMLVVDGSSEKFRWPADWPPIHPEANRYPMIGEDKFRALKASIDRLGLLESIKLDHEGRIISGRNRYRACRELSIEPRMETVDQNARDYVHARDTMRRTQTMSQDIAVILLGYSKLTQVEIADKVGCSQPQVSRVMAGAEMAVASMQASSLTDAYTQIAYGQITEGALRGMKSRIKKQQKIKDADTRRAEQIERGHREFQAALAVCPDEARDHAIKLVRSMLTIQAAYTIPGLDAMKWLDWETVEDED